MHREEHRLEDLGYPSLEGHETASFNDRAYIDSIESGTRKAATALLSLDTEQEALGVSPDFYESLDRDHRILLSALIRIGRRVTDRELAMMLFNIDSPSEEQIDYVTMKMVTLTTRSSFYKQGYTLPQLERAGSDTYTYFWRPGKGDDL